MWSLPFPYAMRSTIGISHVWAVEEQRHRPVVDQMYLHGGAEHALGNGHAVPGGGFEKVFVKALSLLLEAPPERTTGAGLCERRRTA